MHLGLGPIESTTDSGGNVCQPEVQIVFDRISEPALKESSETKIEDAISQ